MITEAPPAPAQTPLDQPRKPRVVIGLLLLVTVIAAYGLSLLGVHLLSKSEGPLRRWI